MSAPTNSFQFTSGATVSAVGGPGGGVAAVRASTAGGAPVQQLVATDLQALLALRGAAAGDASNWLEGIDQETGLPTRYVAVGDDFLVAGVWIDDDGTQAIAAGTSGIDDYASVGLTYLTLVTGSGDDQRITQLMTSGVAFAGPGQPGLASGSGLQSLVSTLVNRSVSFVRKVIQLALDGDEATLAGAAGAAASAADGASAEVAGTETIAGPGGMKIVADIGFEVGTSVGMVLQLVALAALLPLKLLEKRISAWVRVYNATSRELDVTLCFVRDHNASVGVPGNDPVTLPAMGTAWTPPWIIGSTAVHYTSWLVGNTDELEGVGYVVRIAPAGDFAGCAAIVEIPLASDNTQSVVVGGDDDCGAVWAQHHGAGSSLSATVVSGTVRATAAINALSGESPSPVDGRVGYDYEHVLLLEDAAAS